MSRRAPTTAASAIPAAVHAARTSSPTQPGGGALTPARNSRTNRDCAPSPAELTTGSQTARSPALPGRNGVSRANTDGSPSEDPSPARSAPAIRFSPISR